MVPERSQARANPARGIALIATAVIVGIFLFRSGFEGPDTASADIGGDSAAAGDDSDDAPAQTTTTLPAPRNPAEVVVLVLNASGVSGAAASESEALAAAGYQMAPAGNAPEGSDPATTLVYFAPEFQPDAGAVATAIGAPATAVQPMPPPPFDPTGANVVVVLGTDVAG
jgi:LytR cell envelope-related transcriptional attenuator